MHVSIKGNLNLESRQDSNHYDSKQTQAGAGFSVAIYGSGSSAQANYSQNKAKVNYAQVEEQTGFHVGKGGMDVKVAERTLARLPNLQTGNLVKPKVDSEFLSKPLPEGYKYVSLSEIEGPKGGVYHYIGDDAKGNPVFFNNNKFVSFEGGVKKELKSEPNLLMNKTAVGDKYPRPTLRVETKKNIFSQYVQVSDNVLLHKETGEIVNGPFDIGHIPGWEHRRLEEAAKQLGLTRQEFNDYVNARPQNFRLENRSENRSHRNEMPGNGKIQKIKDDMELFLKQRGN